ncbi:MAG TPA: VOC family protein [Mycobacteriales bacterium]
MAASSVRLRQVALVAPGLDDAVAALHGRLGLPEPFRDPGVDAFGLDNVVFALGNTFLEVVAPNRSGTTAGRLLDKRGPGGYMAIFQLADLAAARERATGAGIRIVWQSDLDDIAGTHLHPKDLDGAMVSLDWAEPRESWRWAGPAWIGQAPDHPPGGITGVTIEVADPPATARRWAAVLGADVAPDGTTVPVDGGDQVLRFTAGDRGITEVTVALAADVPGGLDVAGVRLELTAPTGRNA